VPRQDDQGSVVLLPLREFQASLSESRWNQGGKEGNLFPPPAGPIKIPYVGSLPLKAGRNPGGFLPAHMKAGPGRERAVEARQMRGRKRADSKAAEADEERMIRILVVDDHQIVRQGLRQIIEEEPDLELAGEAGSAEAMMKLLREREWDVLVLDITLPGRSGLEVLREVKALKPRMPVLMLSMHPESHYAKQAMADGASGYVTKESAAQEMVKAIRQVAMGGSYLSERLAGELSGGGD
jgi:CheY-like chemotaxis protein